MNKKTCVLIVVLGALSGGGCAMNNTKDAFKIQDPIDLLLLPIGAPVAILDDIDEATGGGVTALNTSLNRATTTAMETAMTMNNTDGRVSVGPTGIHNTPDRTAASDRRHLEAQEEAQQALAEMKQQQGIVDVQQARLGQPASRANSKHTGYRTTTKKRVARGPYGHFRHYPEAEASKCIKLKRRKGGFNVANVSIKNACNQRIHVRNACTAKGGRKTSYGTYSFVSAGLETIRPGRSIPYPSADLCKGRMIYAACVAIDISDYSPHFTNRSGAFVCLAPKK